MGVLVRNVHLLGDGVLQLVKAFGGGLLFQYLHLKNVSVKHVRSQRAQYLIAMVLPGLHGAPDVAVVQLAVVL